MADNWTTARDIVLQWEGGWNNDVQDKGGETIFGIARNFWPSWPGWVVVDGLKTRPDFPACANADADLKSMASDFYEKEVWVKVHGDELPLPMAVALFDMAVNSGCSTAVRLMQSILRIDVDGDVGPQTIKAVLDAGQDGVLRFLARRLVFYKNIWKKDPAQEVWALNWFERIVRLTAKIVVLNA